MSRLSVTFLGSFLLVASPLIAGSQTASPTPASKPEYSKESYVIESLSQKVEFQNAGTSTSETTLRAKVQSDAGVKQLGLLVFQYTQANDTLEIPYVRVLKPDGSTVVTPAGNIQDLPADVTREAPFYSDIRQKHVAVRGLSAGDTLEYQVRSRTHTPLLPGQFWLVDDFTRNAIVLEETLEVSVPADRAVKTKFGELKPTVSEEGGRRIYSWKTSNLKRKTEDELKAEPAEPPPPAVQFTTFQSFEEVGQWYERLQRERVEPTPGIRAKAAELTKGTKSDEEKLKAIYNYVSLNFRYIGIAFGIGRYQPNAAADVLANQYGDCKDKHTLLASLLKAAGLAGYPALINSSRKTDLDMPSPAQFDHVITAVPQGDKYLWLDTTSEVAPFGFLLFSLRDKQALLMPDGKTPVMVRTPEEPPFPGIVSFKVEGKLNDSGTLEAKISRSLRGDLEVIFRAGFRRTPQPQWKDLVQNISYASGFSGTVSNIDVGAPESTDAPFRFSYDYSRKEYPDWANQRITMPCPPYGLAELKDKEEEKRDNLKLGIPLDFTYEGKVTLPKDNTPELPSAVDLKEDFAEYHSTYAFKDGVLRSERHLIVKVKEIPKEKFAAYRKFVKAANEDEGRYISMLQSADDLNSAAARLIDEKKSYSLAIDLLRKAIAKDPNHKWAWNNLGRAYTGLGNLSEAEKAYKRQIEINPKDEYTYKNLGWLYSWQKRYEEALAAYRKHLEVNPHDKDTYSYLGWTLGLMEKWDEAAEAYAKAVSINPEKPDAYMGWGHALLKAGKKEEARKPLQKAVELDSNPSILNNVAYELADAGMDFDQAEQWAKQAVEAAARGLARPLSFDVPPDYWEKLSSLAAYLDTLGWVYFQKGDLNQGEPYLISAHQLRANSIVTEHIARLRAKQDKFDEALQYYAYSQMELGWTGHSAKDLEDYLIKRAGGRDALLARVAEIKNTFGDQRLVKPAGAAFTWPANLTPQKAAYVDVDVLVDGEGVVTDARVLKGDDGFRDAALADARALHLPAISWPGHALPTLRSIVFLYKSPSMVSPEKRVKVWWGLGERPAGNVTLITPDGEHVVSVPPSLAPGTDEQDLTSDSSEFRSSPALPRYSLLMQQSAMRMMSRNVEGAIAKFREAVQTEPDCVACHRLLAEALAQKGDRPGAIAEYKEVVRIEPDNAEHHFTLGAQLEAEGATQAYAGYHFDPKTRTSRPSSSAMPKTARADYESALEQYRLAHQLAPGNASYKEAYERLRRQLKHP